MGKLNDTYRCSLQLAIDVLGGKWKMRILWYLQEGPQRFSDFMRRMPDISQKALTQQLRDLEDAKIVHRKVYAEIPPRVEYSLTQYGLRLGASLQSLSDWAHDYAQEEHITVLTRMSEPSEESGPQE